MPYGQILELMVALLLIGSAPEDITILPVFPSVILFFVKSFLWMMFCIWFPKRYYHRDHGALLEWLSLFPLVIDFYLLGMANLFRYPASFFHLPSLVEIIGLFVFLTYLSMVWFGTSRMQAAFTLEHLGHTLHPIEILKEKLRLLLPMLLPFITISIIMDILSNLDIPFIYGLMQGPYYNVIAFALLILIFFIFLPWLTKKLWDCIPLPRSPLRELLEHGLDRQNVKVSDILIWRTGEIMACTAAVIGIIPGWRYVLLTPCLMEHLNPNEISAVLSHEAEHIRRRHVLWYLVLMIGFSAVMYAFSGPMAAWFLAQPLIIKMIIGVIDVPPSLTAFITITPFIIALIIYFRFVVGFFMRNFERQADMAVFEVQGHPLYLITSLRKVAALSGISLNTPNWHHFSIAQRMEFLIRAYQDRLLIDQHNRKLILAKALWMTAICLLLVISRFMPVDSWRSQANLNKMEIYYEIMTKQHQQDVKWLLAAGIIFLKHERYQMAENVYKKALKLAPDEPDVLNGLAWLYLTSKDKKLFKPKEAMKLALMAAKKKPTGYILDTLAVALFVNGYIERAIKVEHRAIKIDPTNKKYYLKQIERFKGKASSANSRMN